MHYVVKRGKDDAILYYKGRGEFSKNREDAHPFRFNLMASIVAALNGGMVYIWQTIVFKKKDV